MVGFSHLALWEVTISSLVVAVARVLGRQNTLTSTRGGPIVPYLNHARPSSSFRRRRIDRFIRFFVALLLTLVSEDRLNACLEVGHEFG